MILFTGSLMRSSLLEVWRASWGFGPLPVMPVAVVDEDALAISADVKRQVRPA
jgi:hypothetical protein